MCNFLRMFLRWKNKKRRAGRFSLEKAPTGLQKSDRKGLSKALPAAAAPVIFQPGRFNGYTLKRTAKIKNFFAYSWIDNKTGKGYKAR